MPYISGFINGVIQDCLTFHLVALRLKEVQGCAAELGTPQPIWGGFILLFERECGIEGSVLVLKSFRHVIIKGFPVGNVNLGELAELVIREQIPIYFDLRNKI